MKVTELNEEQLKEAKQRYLCEIADTRIMERPYYGELANIDELVTDEEVFEYYSGIEFVPEDFLCSPEYNALPWWEKEE